eukprot:2435135-Amphidinium_carterae.1
MLEIRTNSNKQKLTNNNTYSNIPWEGVTKPAEIGPEICVKGVLLEQYILAEKPSASNDQKY